MKKEKGLKIKKIKFLSHFFVVIFKDCLAVSF